MLDNIIQWSLRNRLLVIALAIALLIFGGIVTLRSPVDVFPDLTAPTITIITEPAGLAPEEVESLVTLPIESAINGAPSVMRVRSNSTIGLSLDESNRIGQLIEEKLHTIHEVVSTTRRTGRAEGDEHAAGVNNNEIEIGARPSNRPHTEVMDEVRKKLAIIPGLDSEVGQPVSHRIDHLLSGTRAPLGSEGRSTATTITSLSAIRSLRRSSLPERARKLLSFTDNRQDASLQAGHFNDFIETTLLRSALYHAVSNAGASGVSYDELTGKVYDALKLPRGLYAKNPDEKFQAIKDTDRALREVIGYRLYRDLERGWRITMPNLEQCGLLQIEYQSLDELCAAEEMWNNCHQALTTAPPETRRRVARILLDYMRRELTINVSYLDSREQEKIKSSAPPNCRFFTAHRRWNSAWTSPNSTSSIF